MEKIIKRYYNLILDDKIIELFLNFISKNENKIFIILILYHNDWKIISKFNLSVIENKIDKKTYSIIKYLYLNYKKIDSNIKILRNIAGPLQKYFKSYDLNKIINTINKRIFPIINSFSKDITSFKLVNNKNEHIYDNEIHSRLMHLKAAFGINLLIINNTKPLKKSEYSMLSLEEKVNYYINFISDFKKLFKNLICDFKNYLLIKDLLTDISQKYINKKHLSEMIQYIEIFFMNMHDNINNNINNNINENINVNINENNYIKVI